METAQNRSQLKGKSLKSLPKSYTDVPPVSLTNNTTPTKSESVIPISVDSEMNETPWLDKITTAFADENQTECENISWSAHYANLQENVPKPPAIITLLPLFRDGAHSPAMIKHGMNLIRQITFQVNPEQIPVLTVDQPLYAIAKRIQWKWPDDYGEKCYDILMGGLHIEMAMLKVLGSWLDGSGWSYVTSANVTTEGRAAGLLKGAHISRGQWAHQVTVAALYIPLQKSYAEYELHTPDDDQMTYEEWSKYMASEHPQFDYWHRVLDLELLFLQFLRSQREQKYIQSLTKIIPWMFALDHYHYARWLTVHVNDLIFLENNSP